MAEIIIINHILRGHKKNKKAVASKEVVLDEIYDRKSIESVQGNLPNKTLFYQLLNGLNRSREESIRMLSSSVEIKIDTESLKMLWDKTVGFFLQFLFFNNLLATKE